MPSNSFNNYGTGHQNVHTGNGDQNINNGSGLQFNRGHFDGPLTFNQSPNASLAIVPRSQGNQRSQRSQYNTSDPDRPTCRDDFQIAIICALVVEYDAVSLLFDQFWDEDEESYGRAGGDTNTYTTGRIGKHNVVLALLPNMGTASAAGAAASFRSSYTSLKLAFLVGVCGGVPNVGSPDELLLGDVVISKTVRNGMGKQYPTGFVSKDTIDDNLGRPNKDIRSLTAFLETELGRERVQDNAGLHLKAIQKKAMKKRRRERYKYPGVSEDKLFAPDYVHKHRETQPCASCNAGQELFCEKAALATCAELSCDETHLVPRDRLDFKQELDLDEAQCPDIFVGRIASRDVVMKCGLDRDEIARQQGVIAFEMEGAGVWDEVPCIVIKGICDYADSHKNKKWQPFAAATAASVMKAVLGRYVVGGG